MTRLRGHPAIGRVGLPVAILTLYFLVPLDADDAPVGEVLGALAAVLCVTVVAWVVVEEAGRARRRLRAVHLLLAFELVLVGFSLGYYLLATDLPGEVTGLHTRLDALYFSLTTMSTVGFGDISASGQLGRLAVSVQLAFNLIFVAALVTLLQDRVRSGRSMAGGDGGHPELGGETEQHPDDRTDDGEDRGGRSRGRGQ